ncbi:MAG: inositol monophosphatase family protein [Pseudomonadales bacterium]|jgi:myo-inositol-1(or 4)-monophosphatase|nr:inositol monophosphatase family protein [Pseudomonadales bacterium]
MQPMANMALRAARSAGRIITRAVDRLDVITVEEKQKNDLVSEVDRAAEAAIVEILHKAFPGHSIIGEESGQTVKGDEDYTWIIDPLDGTTNFLHGIPHFAVSIGCVHRGRLEHAVVLDPLRDESFVASRGHGAQLNERRIRVTRRDRLDSAVVGTGIPYRGTATHLDAYMKQLHAVTRQARGIRRAGSAALDLAYVAAGRLDAFWEIGLEPWDMAAGALLVTEAGGLVSDFEGGSAFLETGNIVCGNPKCFKALLQSIAPHVTRDMKKRRTERAD